MPLTTRRAVLILALAAAAGGACSFLRAADPAVTPAAPRPQERETVNDRILSAGLPRAGAENLKTWHQGPVRYILNGPERRLFKGLESDPERRAFIKQFWLRRDPNVSSLENEFRFEYWQRVLDANQLYTRTSEPGWKTDRGKYHILLGPPDQVDRTTMPNLPPGMVVPSTSADDASQSRRFGTLAPSENFLGLERWYYRHRPRPNLPPNFILAFQLRDSGDYVLSNDPSDFSLFYKMSSEILRPLIAPSADRPDVGQDNKKDILALYNEVALALDLGSAQRIPEPHELLGELVTSEEFFGVIPFLLQVDYYKTTGPATLAVFTLGVDGNALGSPGSGIENVLAVGKLESLSDPSFRILMTGDESLVPSPDNAQVPARPLFQIVRALPPGEYNATFGIMDREQNAIGSYRERILVPAFPAAGLVLSSLSLARRLSPLDDLPPLVAGNAVAPFRLGSYQVVPKTEPRFANGEEFTLYYQIYGAQPDGSGGGLSLHVSYRFFVMKDGAFVPIGKPLAFKDRNQAVQGWSFPLEGWPAAVFRLEVTVKDQISGNVAVGQTIFSIEDDAASL